MKLFWGDLHNHCGITYGSGSLKNALKIARFHLDFCSVTPHAFWPDMPDRNEDTAYIIDFHLKGFEKIRNNWNSYVAAMEEANGAGNFTAFFSFEMHSCKWGDHTFVSPDRNLRITSNEDSPESVIKANNVPMIAIPHHIGYTPGYRGINWDGFDSRYSPVIEVISKHGCAMHDYSGYPYYHDMGPLDSRNTVFRGLNTGKQFSFMGSTDNHAGCPGSFGEGKTAVLADENTRDSIWDSLKNGKTYAVTGNKIKCGFTVNGYTFGSRTEKSKTAEISYNVEAGGAIDRVIIYKNLKPAIITDGLTLKSGAGPYKIKLEFGWSNKQDPFRWDISVNTDGGIITDAEPCFRGVSIIAPSKQRTDSDDVNDLGFELTQINETGVTLACTTFKNISVLHPCTSSVILKIEGNEKTRLDFKINGQKIKTEIAQLLQGGVTGHIKPYASHAWKIHTAVPSGLYTCGSCAVLPGDEKSFYHMEVIQRDGDRAFVSPVFMNG